MPFLDSKNRLFSKFNSLDFRAIQLSLLVIFGILLFIGTSIGVAQVRTAPKQGFTLQLLHTSDQEAGVPALKDAPNFSAVLNALKNQDINRDGKSDYPNTLILSSGDAYIPSPFLFASDTAFGGQGRGDILILNDLGFGAIAFGNHEFDLGTAVVADLIRAKEDYPGTKFPYLSTNLDFSTDKDLARLVTADGQEASKIPNKIARSTIITLNGEKIGIVGATTPTDPKIVAITEALKKVIIAQDGQIFGKTNVFLNGWRGDIRTQETNLGNLTAEANLAIAKGYDPKTVISIKNGGGIRDNIGIYTFPAGSTRSQDVIKLPPQANLLAGKKEKAVYSRGEFYGNGSG
ncbi:MULTISPECIES: DUF4330 family protein [unclassified Nostoc]|uniref:DUF4330 family protein n=1 Tax=unclassified Nostoc TaxID=2593658 RepID=UPI000CF35282|nr:DUF4330 family protein [Nostoc sp. 'Peltigera membranacea cyanobiont' N6]AVH65775.1 bifunctional 2',3'-cyclic nucleotide 2'-phosphodiesterase/5'(3')-nucleotidase precursor protein [Nostoc sp. 'Peltigera membranacea cyanobiont' N6]